ncbi:MAG: L,D-transpeptidase family protein, partial [Pseudomonadota bacterium]
MKPGRADLVVGRWGARFMGRVFPCSIGRGGFIANKREGDGGTPVGAYRMTGGAWRADRLARPATPLPLFPAGPRDRWSDDPRDPAYNQHFRADGEGFSAERLRRADGLYDIVFFTDHNQGPATPGRGSAIFVHCWRAARAPTAGCAAFKPSHLRWIAARWVPGAHPFRDTPPGPWLVEQVPLTDARFAFEAVAV